MPNFIPITDGTEETPQYIPTEGLTPQVQLPPQVQETRARKTHFALGDRSPGVQEVLSQISSGTEDLLRSQVAQNEELDWRQRKLDLITQIGSSETGPLNPEQQDFVMNLAKDKPIKPESIIEELYARRLVDSAAASGGESNKVFRDGIQQATGETLSKMDLAKGLIVKKEIAQKRLEELKARYENLPGIFASQSDPNQNTKLGSFIQGIVPGLQEYQLHNVLAGKAQNSFMPGSNLGDQMNSLWLQRYDRFQEALYKTTEDLWKTNPNAALKFAEAAVHFSTSQRVIDNTLAVAEAASFIPGGVYGKLLRRSMDGARVAEKPAGAVSAAGKGVVEPPAGKATSEPPTGPSGPSATDGAQLELFSKGDRTQTELFPQDLFREQGKPGEAPGQMRGTHVPEGTGLYPSDKTYRDPQTGRMVRPLNQQTQGELPLPPGAHQLQLGLDLGGKPPIPPNAPVLEQVSRALSDVVKGQEGTGPVDLGKVLESFGETEKAGIVRAYEQLENLLLKSDPSKDAKTLLDSLPSISQPFAWYSSGTSMSREYASRAALEAMQYAVNLIQRTADGTQVTRLTPEALAKAVEATQNVLQQKYNYIGDGILNIVHNPKDVLSNTHSVSVHIGRPDGLLFDSPAAARLWADEVYRFAPGQADVGQRGSQFYLDIKKVVPETDYATREALIETKFNQTPRGAANTFLGYLRSAADLVSPFQQANRNVATHAPQEMRALMLDMAKDIGKLSKTEKKGLSRILDANASEVDSVAQRGKYYDSLADFEIAYNNINGHMPSPEVGKAYQRYVQLNDMDMALREFGWLRDMNRTGAENYRFTLANDVKTPWFKGVERENFLPENTGNAGVVYFDSHTKTSHFMYKHDMKDDEVGKQVLQKIKDGQVKIVQVFESQKRPLKETTGIKDEINFIVTDNLENRRIRFGESGEYTPGSHKIYQQPWFVKQPVIETGRKGVLSYFGDKTIINASSEAEAGKWASRMDEARQMLRDKRLPELDDYLQKNLPYNIEEFKDLFSAKGPGGGLSLDHPIVYTYTGRDTFESSNLLREGGYRDLYDRTRSSYDLSQTMDKRFLAERDQTISSFTEKGSTSNPIFQAVPAKVLDPFSALQKGLANSVRSRWMNDYKIAAAESWVSEFKDVFQTKMIAAAERNPLYYLYHPGEILNEATAATKGDILAAAKNSQRAAVNFIGMRSDLGGKVEWMEKSVMNSIYNRAGKEWADTVSERFLPAIQDPSVYLRSVAFHSYLGLFNPVQMFVQAQALVHVTGVSGPTNGIPGTFAGILAKTLRYTENPEIIARYAKIAESIGWKADDFQEAYLAFRNSGMGRVAGETAWRNDVFDPKLFRSTVGTFLDKGTMFFAAGEGLVRDAAYFTAYREWRRANPGKALSDRVQADLVNRANTLSVDMTRASNASWQNGFASVPTQFFAYNARLMDQFLGKRLTTTEKARALATYSVMYGVPIAAGIPTGFADFYGDVRQHGLMSGQEVTNPILEGLHEGILSTALHFATGKEYNVAERYGPNANKSIEEALSGDKSFQDILLGASGKVWGQTIKTTFPFFHYLAGAAGLTDEFPIQTEDFVDVAKNISTLSNASKMYYAWNAGRYLDRKEGYVADVSTMDGVFMGLFGLTPRDIPDTYLVKSGLRDLKHLQDTAKARAVTEFQRAFKDANNAEWDSMNANLARAKVYMEGSGMDPKEKSSVLQQASRGFESLQSKVNRQLLERGDFRERFDLHQRKFNLKGTE